MKNPTIKKSENLQKAQQFVIPDETFFCNTCPDKITVGILYRLSKTAKKGKKVKITKKAFLDLCSFRHHKF